MTSNIKKAVNLTSYFFSLPPAHYLVLGIVIMGLVFGFVLNLTEYSFQEITAHALRDGIVLLVLPALLSSVVVKALIRKTPYRRIAATALGAEFVYGTAYCISPLIEGSSPFLSEIVLLLGAAIVFVLWYVIARLVFILKYRSVLFAVIQLLFYLVFLFSNELLSGSLVPLIDVAARYYISSFILLGALYLFFVIINAPMKKSFGYSSTDAFSFFVSQWLYNNRDLEKAFEQVGENAKTVLSVLSFKRKNDNVLFVTPYVHYGPFGNLGGSRFSYLIEERIRKKRNAKSFVFHGTVTHDLNPVSEKEVDKIISGVESAIKKMKHKKEKVSFSRGKEKECTADNLTIGKDSFFGLSRHPKVTEDINFGLGMSMMYAAEKQRDTATVVDQHNSETGEITSFEPGSGIGYRYLRAIEKSLGKKTKKMPLGIGVSKKKIESGLVGGGGIKTAVFSSSPEYVMVLIDSNGITPKFKNRIEKEIKSIKKGCEVGIYTTDTHQTNIVKGVLNPLKLESETLEKIKQGVGEAYDDLQPAEFSATKEWMEIKVLGAKQSIEIVSTVNSIVAVAKITGPLILVGSMALLLAILSKL